MVELIFFLIILYFFLKLGFYFIGILGILALSGGFLTLIYQIFS